jgi:ABC-type nitrate/sulfonate/bicarbonate transport system permease component
VDCHTCGATSVAFQLAEQDAGPVGATRYTSHMAASGEAATASGAEAHGADANHGPHAAPVRRPPLRAARSLEFVLTLVSIALALGVWELVSRAGLIDQRDLPPMSTAVSELWSMAQTHAFWAAFAQTVRGWALGLGIATALAVPFGILLGSSDIAARAFRVPVEFLRPIPSAALIPLLFLTLGITLKSEVFLATFGAFWPLLVQTMYGVRDVDPVTIDTGRSFGLGRVERLYRITLPSSVPYIATGLRISSTVSLILAFTAELFMGTPGLGQLENAAQSYGLNDQLYAIALATGFLGIAIHVVFSALERRALRWHPSQRAEAQA